MSRTLRFVLSATAAITIAPARSLIPELFRTREVRLPDRLKYALSISTAFARLKYGFAGLRITTDIKHNNATIAVEAVTVFLFVFRGGGGGGCGVASYNCFLPSGTRASLVAYEEHWAHRHRCSYVLHVRTSMPRVNRFNMRCIK